MAEPRVVFDHAVEGVFLRGLEGRLTPSLKQLLREAGLDLEQPLRSTYPREDWRRFILIAAEGLYPDLPPHEAQRRLGEHALDGIQKTLLGRTNAALARLLGPRRTLQRINGAFPTANNFMRVQLTQLEPTRFEVAFNDTYSLPHYVGGGLATLMRIAGARDVRVEILREEDPACTYRLEWTEGGTRWN